MRVISAILVFAFFAAGQTELDQAVRQFHLGEYQSARTRLEGVLGKDPQNAPARLFLALTRAGMGECSAARRPCFASTRPINQKS